jgi:hypothetical protein
VPTVVLAYTAEEDSQAIDRRGRSLAGEVLDGGSQGIDFEVNTKER